MTRLRLARLRLARRSLILRLVGLSLLLLLIVQAAGFAVVRASIDRNARAQIARALDLDENIWRRLLEQNAERLRQGSALLAADYGFRSAVNSGDEDTIQSVLENHGSRIGAAVTAWHCAQSAWPMAWNSFPPRWSRWCPASRSSRRAARLR